VINCTINGVIYRLKALVSKIDKQLGLKAYPELPRQCGVIFVYKGDNDSSFNFSKIDYQCRILFLDSDYRVIHHEKTDANQVSVVTCPIPFRYVIEIGV